MSNPINVQVVYVSYTQGHPVSVQPMKILQNCIETLYMLTLFYFLVTFHYISL